MSLKFEFSPGDLLRMHTRREDMFGSPKAGEVAKKSRVIKMNCLTWR